MKSSRKIKKIFGIVFLAAIVGFAIWDIGSEIPFAWDFYREHPIYLSAIGSLFLLGVLVGLVIRRTSRVTRSRISFLATSLLCIGVLAAAIFLGFGAVRVLFLPDSVSGNRVRLWMGVLLAASIVLGIGSLTTFYFAVRYYLHDMGR